MARRIENREPITFDLGEREDHGVRAIHFYIGDDDDEPCQDRRNPMEENSMEIENEESKVRRLGEENEDVAIAIDSGADVALFPLSMADYGEGELKTKLHI